jgi:hypothetical protein
MALIAHYQFEQNANDSVGSNNGTITGSLGDTIGKLGYGYVFAGDSAYINLGDTIILPHGSWSVSYWFSATIDGGMTVGATGINANRFYHRDQGDSATAKVRIHPNDAASFDLDFNKYVIDGAWHLLIVVAKGDSMILYLDGEFADTATNATNEFHVNNIGYPYSAPSHIWWGELDDVRFYDHVLSTLERRELWWANILHYSFDDFVEPTINRLVNGDFGDSVNGWTIGLRGAGFNDHRSIKTDEFGDTYLNLHWARTSGSGNSWGSIRRAILNSGDTGNYTESCYIRINDASGPTGQLRLSAVINDYWTTDRVVWGFGGRDLGVWHYVYLTGLMGAGDTHALNINYEIYTGAQATVGDSLDIDIKFCQIEQKDHPTPFVGDSRYGAVTDSSGQGNDSATLSQTYTPEWRGDSAKFGNGYYHFAGDTRAYVLDDYIQAFTPAQGDIWLDSETNHGITIMLWARVGDSFTDTGGRLISRDVSDWWAITTNATVAFPQNVAFYSEAISETINDVFVQDEWVHLAMTRDVPNSETKYYINGVKTGATDTSGAGTGNIRGVTIGHNEENGPSPGSANSAFNGDIDDVRIYMNTLTEAEILEIVQTSARVDDAGNFHAKYIKEPIVHRIVESSTKYCVYSTNKSLGTLTMDETDIVDMRAANGWISSGDTLGNIKVMYDVFLSNATYYPARFEYTKINNDQGFTVTGASQTPSGGWVAGWNHVEFDFNDITYVSASDTPWENMTRLEMYRPGDTAGDSTEYLIFRNIRLLKYTDETEIDFKFKVDGSAWILDKSEIGPVDGLLAHWKLNGDTADSTGNGYHGTLNVSAGGGGFESAIDNLGYHFYGDTDSINIAYSWPEFSAYTIALWLKIDDFTSDTNPRIVQLRNSSSGHYIIIYLATSNDKITTGIYNGTNYLAFTNGAMSADTWYHVMATYDGETALTYINNVLQTDTGVISGFTLTPNQGAIGANPSNLLNNNFDGTVDDVRIYNKCLSAEERGILYTMYDPNSNVKMKISESGTVYVPEKFLETL